VLGTGGFALATEPSEQPSEESKPSACAGAPQEEMEQEPGPILTEEIRLTAVGAAPDCPATVRCAPGCHAVGPCALTDTGLNVCGTDGTIGDPPDMTCKPPKTIHISNCHCAADVPGTACLHIHQDLVCH
jgi:hypothetical protein